MRPTVEHKIIGTIFFCTVVIIIISAAIIWPTIKEIVAAQRETYQLRQFLERKNQQAVHARINRARGAEIKEMAALFPDHIFLSGQELKLITSLESIAAAHHVSQKIKDNNFDSINNQRLTLSLSVTGNYLNVLEYFSSIEALPYFLTTRELRFTATTDPVLKTETITLDLDLILYVSAP